MDQRFSLRFETGERKGESIPIPAGGLTVGRKPGNALILSDSSVSGKHAEIVVESGNVSVRDLGSTNGTRVGPQRITDQRLAHGDVVQFGNVRLVFHDMAVGGTPADWIELEGDELAASTPSGSGRADEGLLQVSPDLIAKSKKRSVGGVMALAVLAAGGAGLWFWLNRDTQVASGSARAVESLPGDLLGADASFESDNDGWSAFEGSPAAFLKNGAASRSGAYGIEVDLADGAYALHRSRELRATSARAASVAAHVRTQGGASVRLGLQFQGPLEGDTQNQGSVFAWSAPAAEGTDFERLELVAEPPPGFTSMRVVLYALGPGTAAVDDVALVEVAPLTAASVGVGDTRVLLLGAPPSNAVLSKGERTLITAMYFAALAEAETQAAQALGAQTEGGKIVLSNTRSARFLVLQVEAPLARARVASMGTEGGYRSHAGDFERAGIDSLMLGSGADLVRFKFERAVNVRATPSGVGGLRLVLEEVGPTLELQVDFADERRSAGDVAHQARNAEKRGELGPALAQWAELLDRFPFEDALVAEAEAARSKLLQQGLSELRAVRADLERSRFFRLAGLLREAARTALQVGARYAGSEVEAQAKALAAEVETELATLEVESKEQERKRLSAILATLQARQEPGLADEVRGYLEKLQEQH